MENLDKKKIFKKIIKKLDLLLTTNVGKDTTKEETQQLKEAVNEIFEQIKHRKVLLLEAAELLFNYFSDIEEDELTKHIIIYVVENETGKKFII